MELHHFHMEAFRFIDIFRKNIGQWHVSQWHALCASCSPAVSSCLCSNWSHDCCVPSCKIRQFWAEQKKKYSYSRYVGNRDSISEKGLRSWSPRTGLSCLNRGISFQCCPWGVCHLVSVCCSRVWSRAHTISYVPSPCRCLSCPRQCQMALTV